MLIRKGTQLINKKTKQAIIEFDFDDYTIFVFQGNLSKNDIIIKYRKNGTHLRTPKHIHWAVDILMKMQGNEPLTREYLREIQKNWESCKPLQSNDYESIKKVVVENALLIDINKFSALNNYGEYNVEFLFVLMELLAVQEKTNRPDAYMFGNIIKELLKEKKDIFKIMSQASFGGKR